MSPLSNFSPPSCNLSSICSSLCNTVLWVHRSGFTEGCSRIQADLSKQIPAAHLVVISTPLPCFLCSCYNLPCINRCMVGLTCYSGAKVTTGQWTNWFLLTLCFSSSVHRVYTLSFSSRYPSSTEHTADFTWQSNYILPGALGTNYYSFVGIPLEHLVFCVCYLFGKKVFWNMHFIPERAKDNILTHGSTEGDVSQVGNSFS